MTDHPNRFPHYANTFSTGNVIQILITVAAVSGAFVTLDGQAERNKSDISRISAEQGTLESRIRILENQSVRSDERLSSVLTLLSRIDQRLERIETIQAEDRPKEANP